MAPPKGFIPWNKGKKTGIEPWNKGKTGVFSEEVLEKMRQPRPSMLGDNNPAKRPDVQQKISDGQRGEKSPRYGKPGFFLGKHHSDESLEKMRKPRPSIQGDNHPSKRSEERLKRAELWKGDKNPSKRPDVRLKNRESQLRRLEERFGIGQVAPNYNPEACRLIDEYGQQHGYSFQHAENGGEFYIKELCYWVDGYDAEKNVVIEVYESRHNRTVERDQRRQAEITEHLGCEFIILHTE